MKLSIKTNTKELRKVRLEMEVYCKSNFINFDTSKAIIAVDEALQNVIRYAYEMKPNEKIEISFEKFDDDSLKVVITDYGKQAPLESIKSRNLDKVRPGGLGVYFIKQCSKSSEYKHLPNGVGTELTLTF
jgi:serine/threonine-protein kinase RsbW